MGKEIRKAVAYLRTSSRTNVGADKDSDKRQRAAIEAYARIVGYEIVETFYDAAVSGADPVGDRPGLAEMLERLLSNSAREFEQESQGQESGRHAGLPCHEHLHRGRTLAPRGAV